MFIFNCLECRNIVTHSVQWRNLYVWTSPFNSIWIRFVIFCTLCVSLRCCYAFYLAYSFHITSSFDFVKASNWQKTVGVVSSFWVIRSRTNLDMVLIPATNPEIDFKYLTNRVHEIHKCIEFKYKEHFLFNLEQREAHNWTFDN